MYTENVIKLHINVIYVNPMPRIPFNLIYYNNKFTQWSIIDTEHREKWQVTFHRFNVIKTDFLMKFIIFVR